MLDATPNKNEMHVRRDCSCYERIIVHYIFFDNGKAKSVQKSYNFSLLMLLDIFFSLTSVEGFGRVWRRNTNLCKHFLCELGSSVVLSHLNNFSPDKKVSIFFFAASSEPFQSSWASVWIFQFFCSSENIVLQSFCIC